MQERANRKAAQIVERTTRLLLRGAHAKALPMLREATGLYPGDAAILTRYADALYQAERVGEAKDNYRKALAIDANVFQAWYGCGMAEFSAGAYAGAIDCFRHAVALEPRDLEARSYLGKSLFQMGEIDSAINEFMVVARSKDEVMRREALRQIAVIIPGSPSHGNGPILKARQKWARLEEKSERPRSAGLKSRTEGSRKLRIGYVSSFFHHRNWMKPVWGMINRHDRSAFEIHLFADRGSPSVESGYQADPHDFIHVTTGLSNEKAAAKIFAAGIDVLVDLNGYSAPERLGIFMRKPAPSIVGWFNMFATSGIRAFDYIVGDASVIPPEEERFYCERVLRVSGSYLAFSVLYPVPPVVPPPCLRTGRFTFGCLAPQYKITNEEIAVWTQILVAAPAASVLLKSTCLDEASNRAAVHAKFDAHGIAPERVLLEGSAEHSEFLEAYARVDVALDTFPYNGGTTTAEAIWQGVPVLAFNGDRWVGRISRSILVAAGLGDWVEASLESYIQRAIRLAQSPATPGQLADLRCGMRERLLASAACDTAALCREMEAHYRAVACISDVRGRAREGKLKPNRPC
ncbi:MAG: tetratricopeptide repeat protein [Candidatus Acidiferrales bacterium]